MNLVLGRYVIDAERAVRWIVIAVLAALVTYFGFRAYLTPELLFNFANAFYC